MLNRIEIIKITKEIIEKFTIKDGDLWLISGAALVMYGIKPFTSDIDIGCTEEFFNTLISQGFTREKKYDYENRICLGTNIEVFGGMKNTSIEYIEGVPVASIDDIICFKKTLHREKDEQDIVLINDYLDKKCRDLTIPYYCLSITDDCNQNCQYCYRPRSAKKNMSVEEAKKCLRFMKRLNSERVNITGGETLLNPEWRRIIWLAKELGYNVMFSSNGLLLNINDPIFKYVSVLEIPLDGSNEEFNSRYRSGGHYAKVRSIINQYINGDYTFILKINTVVTRYNMADVLNIAKILKCGRIIWRLFRCKKIGYYNSIDDAEIISLEEFIQVIKKIHIMLGTQLVIADEDILRDINNDYYLLIDSSSTVSVTHENSNSTICNVLTATPNDLKSALYKKYGDVWRVRYQSPTMIRL